MRDAFPRSLGSKIRVRVKRRWRGYRPDDVINPPGGLRKILLQQGIVEPIQEIPAIEATVVDHPPIATDQESPENREPETDTVTEDKPRRRKRKDIDD